jgi:hypothetical protein
MCNKTRGIGPMQGWERDGADDKVKEQAFDKPKRHSGEIFEQKRLVEVGRREAQKLEQQPGYQ